MDKNIKYTRKERMWIPRPTPEIIMAGAPASLNYDFYLVVCLSEVFFSLGVR